MSIIIFYQKKLEEINSEKAKVKAQIEVLQEKINTNRPTNKNWMIWWQEKNDLSNKLCELIGSEKYYEQKIASLQ